MNQVALSIIAVAIGFSGYALIRMFWPTLAAEAFREDLYDASIKLMDIRADGLLDGDEIVRDVAGRLGERMVLASDRAGSFSMLSALIGSSLRRDTRSRCEACLLAAIDRLPEGDARDRLMQLNDEMDLAFARYMWRRSLLFRTWAVTQAALDLVTHDSKSCSASKKSPPARLEHVSSGVRHGALATVGASVGQRLSDRVLLQ